MFLDKFLTNVEFLIEINDNIFKIALMKKHKNQIEVYNIERFIIKNQSLRKREIKEFIIKYIKKNDLKLKNNSIYTTLDDENDLFTDIIEIPSDIKKRNINKTLKANFNSYLPFQDNIDIENYNYDYHIIEEKNNYKILLATIKKNVVEKYSSDLFLSQESNFYSIYVKPFVLFNTLKTINNHDTSAILNFSKDKTHLVIATEGKYKFHKTIDVGKNSFLKTVSKKTSQEIDEIKITSDYFKEKENETIDFDLDLRNIMQEDNQINKEFKSIGEELLQEIDMVMAYFNNKFKESVNNIYFVENQDKLPGLFDYLKNNLNIPVNTIENGLINIKSDKSFNENAVLFSTALNSNL
jgi:Tfp pilus assembly PilM family ATPase